MTRMSYNSDTMHTWNKNPPRVRQYARRGYGIMCTDSGNVRTDRMPYKFGAMHFLNKKQPRVRMRFKFKALSFFLLYYKLKCNLNNSIFSGQRKGKK